MFVHIDTPSKVGPQLAINAKLIEELVELKQMSRTTFVKQLPDGQLFAAWQRAGYDQIDPRTTHRIENIFTQARMIKQIDGFPDVIRLDEIVEMPVGMFYRKHLLNSPEQFSSSRLFQDGFSQRIHNGHSVSLADPYLLRLDNKVVERIATQNDTLSWSDQCIKRIAMNLLFLTQAVARVSKAYRPKHLRIYSQLIDPRMLRNLDDATLNRLRNELGAILAPLLEGVSECPKLALFDWSTTKQGKRPPHDRFMLCEQTNTYFIASEGFDTFGRADVKGIKGSSAKAPSVLNAIGQSKDNNNSNYLIRVSKPQSCPFKLPAGLIMIA